MSKTSGGEQAALAGLLVPGLDPVFEAGKGRGGAGEQQEECEGPHPPADWPALATCWAHRPGPGLHYTLWRHSLVPAALQHCSPAPGEALLSPSLATTLGWDPAGGRRDTLVHRCKVTRHHGAPPAWRASFPAYYSNWTHYLPGQIQLCLPAGRRVLISRTGLTILPDV
jgi:hypothetical protein